MSNGESVARKWRVCRESCSCKLEQPNDGRSQNLGVNFLRFAFRTGKTAGTADATPSTTQNQKQHNHWHQRRPSRMYGCTDRLSRQQEAPQRTHAKFARKSFEKSSKKRSKVDEESTEFDEKSTKNRSWAVLGVQGRVRDVSRRARDGSWTSKNRSKADLGTPRASQERPRAVQKRPPDGPKTHPDRPGATSECIWSIEHCRTSPQNDFSLFLCRRAEAPMCEKCSSCQCFVHFARS